MTEGPDESSAPVDATGKGDIPRDVLLQQRRTALLEAMIAVCAERGYLATTVEQVLKRAAVPGEAFDELFRDKEDCFLAAAQVILGEVMTAVTNQYTPDKPLYQVNRDAIEALLTLLASKPDYAVVALMEYRTSTPKAFEIYQSAIRVLLSLLDQLRADSPGEVVRPSTAARGAVGGVEAMIRREVAAGRAERLVELIPRAVYAALVPFLGQEEALRQHRLMEEKLAAN